MFRRVMFRMVRLTPPSLSRFLISTSLPGSAPAAEEKPRSTGGPVAAGQAGGVFIGFMLAVCIATARNAPSSPHSSVQPVP